MTWPTLWRVRALLWLSATLLCIGQAGTKAGQRVYRAAMRDAPPMPERQPNLFERDSK